MALSNAERQRKWVEKNRAVFNLRRRNVRKKKGGDATLTNAHADSRSDTPTDVPQLVSNAAPTVQPAGAAKDATKEYLRGLIEKASSEPVKSVVKSQLFRDDYGRVITEAQYRKLQERKEAAKKGNYVLDDYSQ